MDNKMIVTLTGHKNCGKTFVAELLAKNSEVEYLKPYTDMRWTLVFENDYNFVSKEELDNMMETEPVLCVTKIDGVRFVFFKHQLTAQYNVMIVDDYALANVRTNWKGKLYTIKVKSEKEIESDRVGEYYYDHEFDEIFNYDYDDYDELEARISYGFR